MQRLALGLTVAVLAVIVAMPAGAHARAPDAIAAAECSKETKRLKVFKRGMKAAKRRFFRSHRSANARKRFVAKQRRKLARLKRARKRCLTEQPPAAPPAPPPPAAPAGPPAPPPPPPPPPPPGAPVVDAIEDVISDAARFRAR